MLTLYGKTPETPISGADWKTFQEKIGPEGSVTLTGTGKGLRLNNNELHRLVVGEETRGLIKQPPEIIRNLYSYAQIDGNRFSSGYNEVLAAYHALFNSNLFEPDSAERAATVTAGRTAVYVGNRLVKNLYSRSGIPLAQAANVEPDNILSV